MSEQILKAMQRVRAVLARRPQAGLHADEPASARWDEGLRVVTRHANGTQITTDMPAEVGGEGNRVSPGWLLGQASRPVLQRASRWRLPPPESFSRGSRLSPRARRMCGVSSAWWTGGEPVTPAPSEVHLEVNIGASNAPHERLRALIDASFRCSPVSAAVERAVPVRLHVNLETG